MSKYDQNKAKLPDLDLFPTTRNTFLQDIHRKAQRYKLTDKQVSAAQRAWDRMSAKKTAAAKVAIKLSDSDVETILYAIEQMIQMRGMYVGGDFLYDIRGRVKTKKTLSPKQYAAMIRSMTRYKKAFFRRVFHERKRK
jgi:hypothetical protein